MASKIEPARNIGLLALRAAVGGTLFAHGAQKLLGWFGGHGLDGTGAFFESIGFRPGKSHAIAAGLGEAGGGGLLVAGLATGPAGAAAAGTMCVAASTHEENGFFAQQGGFELPVVLGASAAGLALTGPGSLSLDTLTRYKLNRPWMRILAFLVVLPVAQRVIASRRAALGAGATPDQDTTSPSVTKTSSASGETHSSSSDTGSTSSSSTASNTATTSSSTAGSGTSTSTPTSTHSAHGGGSVDASAPSGNPTSKGFPPASSSHAEYPITAETPIVE